MIEFDYSALAGKIVEVCRTRKAFSALAGMTPSAVSMKLNNKVSWKQSEINKTIDVLGIDQTEIGKYFFCRKSSKS